MPDCLIGLGANLGDRQATLTAALRQLDESPTAKVVAHSAWRETPPIGGPSEQAAYLNGAALLQTSLGPEALLEMLLSVEEACGRVRGERWSARTIDLDLLLAGGAIVSGPRLTLPHPRLAFRRFVLEPAVEVAPRMVHPRLGWRLERILRHLNESADYVAIASPRRQLAAQVAEAVCAGGFRSRLSLATGSSGRERITPVELLQRVEKLLDRATWPPSQWAVSDFWAPQLLADAEAGADPLASRELRRRYRALSSRLTAPKLLIAMDDDDSASQQSANETRRQTFWRQVDRPGQGPTLRLPGVALDEAIAESLAALDALRPIPDGGALER